MTLDIINRFNVTDDATLALSGARSVATAVVDGVTYLFVAGAGDNGLSVFSVGADGSLVHVENVLDTGLFNLAGVFSVTTAQVGGVSYLFAAGVADHGVSVFRVDAGGSLANVFNVTDDPSLALRFANSVTTAAVDGVTYLFATGLDDGVSVFAVGNDGSLTNVENVFDNGTLNLAGDGSVTTAVVDGVTYLFATGSIDDGVSVFRVDAGGSLSNVANIDDDATLNLESATAAATGVVGGVTYLFVASSTESGVSVFRVDPGGLLTNVDNVSDGVTLDLAGVNSVTTAVIAGVTYLFVTASFDSSVSVFSVGADGRLSNVANVADDATLQLDFVSSVTTAAVGGTPYLFAAGTGDNGVSVFELATDDTLIGTDGADALDGHAGDDLIVGLGGDDLLTGGSGNDTILGESGADILHGGSGDDTLYGGAGDADHAGYSGARADYEVTRIDPTTVRIRDLRAGSPDGTDTVTDVEVFHFAAANQTLSFQQLLQVAQLNATDGPDTLLLTGGQTVHALGGSDNIGGTGNLNVAFGDDGNDLLYFNGNQNQLFGSNGDDWLGVNGTNNALVGGAGNDWIGASGTSNTLAGGDGNDSLFANGTNNYLHGQADNDWIGVSGNDNFLFGGAGDDWLGASGNGNTLDGGAGNDTLVSAAGNLDTTFVFHAGYGQDTISNFASHGAGGSDVIDLNGFGLNFSSLQGYAADVDGNVVITLDAATILTINGVTVAQLQASDFIF